jgi:multicomponent K+:H+ antiporter subunit A
MLMLVTLAAALTPLWLTLRAPVQWTGERPTLTFSPMFALLWAVGIGAAIGTAWQAKYHRLTALALMSVAGLTTVITFAWFSAPDLALTQLSVEAVTTVLFVLGLRWLPKRIEKQDHRRTHRALHGRRAPGARATCWWRWRPAPAWRCCPMR